MGSVSYSLGSTLYYAGCEDHLYEPHFLQSCSLCSKPLGFNSDIFMYRGDTPFCSKECRQEQIDNDLAKERSLVKKKKTASSSSSSSSNKNVRSGTVAVS